MNKNFHDHKNACLRIKNIAELLAFNDCDINKEEAIKEIHKALKKIQELYELEIKND